MAPSFARSISFPLSPARSNARRHVRSISLPSSSRTDVAHHPLLAHLHDTVAAVSSWAAEPTAAPSTGLAHLDALHAALAEVLLLPEARAALRATADCLLVLADAYGAFQEALLHLKGHAAEVQAALRRRDAARLSSAVRAQRQAEKDIARLASSVRRWPLQIEVSGMLAEALAAVASASAAVFSAVESVSSAATTAAASFSKKSSSATLIISQLVKRTTTKTAASSSDDALERLQDLEECISEIQAGSDKVFRSILHTRVALLNIQTHTC